MATKKRSKSGGVAASRRPRARAKTTAATKKRTTVASKAKATAKPAQAKRKTTSASAAPKESREVVALKAKFQRDRLALEKRLTEAVREIGVLRHHELRAMQLERQLAEREATIGRLQSQLAELERRPAEAVYVGEVQQSLALGAPAHDLDETAPDLDEFEEERLGEDADLITDEE
jgi:hypothetical protein